MSEHNVQTWSREDGEGVYFTGTNLKGSDIEGLNLHVRVALALNDECCGRGFGRFYVFVSHSAEKRVKREELGIALGRVPAVFYVPEVWTRTERQDWRNGSARWQISRTYARNGWVMPDHQPILPLRLDVYATKSATPRFEGLTLAPLLVLFAPAPYVAPVKEIEALGNCGKTRNKREWAYQIDGNDAGWAKISHWRCQSLADVVELIEQYCRDSSRAAEPRMMAHKSLTEWFARIHITADDIR